MREPESEFLLPESSAASPESAFLLPESSAASGSLPGGLKCNASGNPGFLLPGSVSVDGLLPGGLKDTLEEPTPEGLAAEGMVPNALPFSAPGSHLG
jgi:hypothetical protein